MKNVCLTVVTILSFILFSACGADKAKDGDGKKAGYGPEGSSELIAEPEPGANPDAEASSSGFGQLFVASPCDADGEQGCNDESWQTSVRCIKESLWDSLEFTCNTNASSYFQYDDTSMTITAGNDCRTVNTGTNNTCKFTIGDNGVTQISFDFEVSGPCHDANIGTDWFAFWIYSNPWNKHVEADFIEGCNGPARGGLNTNFAGSSTQQYIFQESDPGPWKGSITASFSGSGDAVTIQVKNTVRPNAIAGTTLQRDTGYVFVLNTTPTLASGCTVQISNLKMEGTVPAGSCAGLISN